MRPTRTDAEASGSRNIALNALFLAPGATGGMEVFIRRLLTNLAAIDGHNQYFVYRCQDTDREMVPIASNFHDRPLPVRSTARLQRLLFEQTVFLAFLARDRIDVLFNGSYVAPLCSWFPMVTVFYDFHYKHFGTKHGTRLEVLLASVLFPASLRRSAAIVTMSRSVFAEIERYFPWAKGRIAIVAHSADPDLSEIAARRSAAGDGTRTNVIFAASGLAVHKNFARLLQAFALFRRSHPEYRLVVSGYKSRDGARLEALRTSLALDERVEFTGWIDRDRFLEIFAGADAFVHASLLEGFGIPVLEALAAGVPLGCSRIEPIVEIAGDAARYFDPESVEDIAAALCDLVDDVSLRRRLQAAGPVRAAQFDPRENAMVLRRVFESIGARG